MILSSKIKEYAREVGFTLCGIARVRHLGEQSERLSEWLGRGYDSGLAYMGRNIEKRLDPALLYKGAKSIIVCAANYKNEHWDQSMSPNPKISSYALSPDYHITIKDKLNRILGFLKEEHPHLHGRCFTDSAPVLEKSWAIEAGLGWRGKNSLIVTPDYGSFIFLGEIIINVEVDLYDEPYGREGCGNCTACIDACPNSAIVRPYVIDTNRCISRLTTESHADGMCTCLCTHGWIYGCDICQSVCPYNRHTPMFSDPAFRAIFDPSQAKKEFWDKFDEPTFALTFGSTPMDRGGFDALKQRKDQFFRDKIKNL